MRTFQAIGILIVYVLTGLAIAIVINDFDIAFFDALGDRSQEPLAKIPGD